MSTGLNCQFYEAEPGQWYYVLEDWDAPKMSWDWREHATAYGPFVDEDATWDHLRDNHANPGGYGVTAFEERLRDDEVLQKLIGGAVSPSPPRRSYWR